MITINELFAGIGSQSAALKRLGIDFKVVGIAEIDKYAIKSYEAIHGSVRNYGDISKIDKLDYADFWTYSFPCQDISIAGNQKGINENTRSGLLYQVERLLQASKESDELPKYLMLENVKNLVGKKFKSQFEDWIKRLDELGYNTYWQVLNAKNYGIPQNRERVFAISIRKDLEQEYEFPKQFDLKIRLKDILEKEVDEKYYLSDEKVQMLLKQGNVNPSGRGMNGNVCTGDICNTITTNKGEEPKVLQIGNIVETGNFQNPQRGRIYSMDGCSPALNCVGGGGLEPKILEPCVGASRGRNPMNPSDRTVGIPTEQRLEINKNGTSNTITTVQKDNYVLVPQATKQGYIECNIPGVADLSFPDSKTRRGRVQDSGEICPTLMAGQQDICYIEQQYRIRKLTPLECWRLMGFTDEQFKKAEKVNSNSQLYKQAGNSIVVDVLYYLFKNLFIDKQPTKENKVETEMFDLKNQITIDQWIGVC